MAHRHSQRGNVELDGLPALVAARHPLAMVYGGGGVFGIAYTSGVAAGLAQAGVPVTGAPSLGTSAGSWTASALALGVTYDDFATVSSPKVPNRHPGVLADVARQLFGEQRHPLVAVSAVCVRTRRRHILDGGTYPLADLVAASSAVPGLLPPHRIDGRLYVDGGMWSATSVDAAAEADHVIVVAPLAGSVLGPVGQTAGLLLERELRRWRERHPESTITLVRPDRDMARIAGRHPLALFDDARAHDVHPLAHEQGLRVGTALVAATTGTQDGADDGPAA
jgi:predicted acylesterase/phospholipase RssA